MRFQQNMDILSGDGIGAAEDQMPAVSAVIAEGGGMILTGSAQQTVAEEDPFVPGLYEIMPRVPHVRKAPEEDKRTHGAPFARSRHHRDEADADLSTWLPQKGEGADIDFLDAA